MIGKVLEIQICKPSWSDVECGERSVGLSSNELTRSGNSLGRKDMCLDAVVNGAMSTKHTTWI